MYSVNTRIASIKLANKQYKSTTLNLRYLCDIGSAKIGMMHATC